MGLETWSGLQKSATDPETIEQAIARLIAVHEADPTSHLGVGESLQAHKNADVIDHPALSIVSDKYGQASIIDALSTDIRFYLDADLTDVVDWGATGSSFGRQGYAEFATGTTANTEYVAEMPPDEQSGWYMDTTKNPTITFYARAGLSTSQVFRFGMMHFDSDSGVGFKIDDNAVKAIWYDNSNVEHVTAISGVAGNVLHLYTVKVISGDRIEWYVDGALVYTLTPLTNFPTVDSMPPIAVSTLKKTSSNRVFVVNRIMFSQDY